jgi:DNA-binding protein HU-beta
MFSSRGEQDWTLAIISITRKMREPMAERKSKTDVINEIAAATGETKTSVGKILDAALETIQKCVTNGEEVAFIGFGTFKSSARNARVGRNPRTGEAINIAAVTLPKFVAGKAFKDEVNK